MENKKNIKITEGLLNKLISESLNKHLNEVSYDTLKSAERKSDIDFSEVYDALITIQEALNTYDSESFHNPSDRWNHFLKTGREPIDSSYEKFTKYLDEIREFFKRKESQHETFSTGKSQMGKNYDDYLLNYARQQGYEGRDFWEIEKNMSYDELDDFVNGLPEELQQYVEQEY